MHQDDVDYPWYRQFWPWFIILLPASAVVASLYTVSLAFRTTDSLVISAEGGVDVVTERILAAERTAQALGLVATIAIDGDTGAVIVDVANSGTPAAGRALELLFSHPTDVRRDRRVTLSPAPSAGDGTARWAGHLVDVPTGRYYVVLASGDEWRLSGAWSGARQTVLRPIPAANGG